jgi:hypothetical protein
VIPHLVDGGLSIIQYADDTILFMEHDLENARNLKLILAAFEHLLGLNFFSIKVSCFALVRRKTRLAFMPTCSDVGKANFQLGTWGFCFIIRDTLLSNGN